MPLDSFKLKEPLPPETGGGTPPPDWFKAIGCCWMVIIPWLCITVTAWAILEKMK